MTGMRLYEKLPPQIKNYGKTTIFKMFIKKQLLNIDLVE